MRINGKYYDTPISGYENSYLKFIYTRYLQGISIEQIAGALSIKYNTHSMDLEEINDIIDKMNEIYL
jgi:hypothetical protein